MAAPQQLPCPPFWADQAVIDCLCPDLVDVNGPCDPGAPTPATYPYTDAEFNEMASKMLFERTCRRFPGICSVTLRPCDPCRDCGDCCTCHYEFIPLAGPYPVIDVTEVKIDGVVVPPSSYRVDEFIRLVRTDGELWPRWQNMNADPDLTTDTTMRVSYTTGREAPADLKYAAALLVCELKKACNGRACRLPDRVTSVVRDGVSYEVVDAQEIALDGSFGVPMIDTILATYPCDQKNKRPEPTSRLLHPLLDGERYDRSGVRA